MKRVAKERTFIVRQITRTSERYTNIDKWVNDRFDIYSNRFIFWMEIKGEQWSEKLKKFLSDHVPK